MDCEAIDGEMSCWVVSCKKNDIRFYLQQNGLATDLLELTPRYRWQDQAEKIAEAARQEDAWVGFNWQSVSRAEIAGE